MIAKRRIRNWDSPFLCLISVRNVGLEPTRLTAQEPKSCMSANSISSAHVPYVIICTPKSQLQNFQHICRCKYQHKQWLVQKIQKQTMSACCLQKRNRQMYPQSILHFWKLHKHSIQEISGQIKKNPWKQRKIISGKKSRIRETKKRHKESPIQDFRHPSKIK